MADLCGLRRDPLYRACVAVLDDAGIRHRLVPGGKHARLEFRYRGRRYVKPIPFGGSKETVSVKKAKADLRRIIRDADREASPAATALMSVPMSIRVFDGEPRIRDEDLGARLGFSEPNRIRQLIGRNEDFLRDISVLHVQRETSGPAGGRPPLVYYLTEAQALYVAAISEAPTAHEVRKMLIEVFMAWRRGHLAPAEPQPAIGPDAAAAIGGVCKVVVRKQLEPVIAAQELIIEGIASLNARISAIEASGALPAPAKAQAMVTAHEVVSRMAEVPQDKMYGGLAGQVSSRLNRYCARHGYQVGVVDLRPGEKLSFPRDAAAEWLANGGRREIWVLVQNHVAKKAGQTVLPFHVKR